MIYLFDSVIHFLNNPAQVCHAMKNTILFTGILSMLSAIFLVKIHQDASFQAQISQTKLLGCNLTESALHFENF